VLELTLVLFSCSFLIIIFVCYLFFLPFVVNKDFHKQRPRYAAKLAASRATSPTGL